MKNLSEILISDNTDMLLEMARVGDMDSKLAIYIRSNDPGNIPHFHIALRREQSPPSHLGSRVSHFPLPTSQANQTIRPLSSRNNEYEFAHDTL